MVNLKTQKIIIEVTEIVTEISTPRTIKGVIPSTFIQLLS